MLNGQISASRLSEACNCLLRPARAPVARIYFADGLTQDIINASAAPRGLTVDAHWNAVLPYKAVKAGNPADIARHLRRCAIRSKEISVRLCQSCHTK